MAKLHRNLLFKLVYFCWLAAVAQCTNIGTFLDDNCQKSQQNLDGPNGYPDGTCSLLEQKGTYGSFMVVNLDYGCSVSIYGKNVDERVCSDPNPQVAKLATCYNASWVYYSIDGCTKPDLVPTPLPLPTSSSVSATSNSNKPENTSYAILGGVIVGGVFGLCIIGLTLYFIYRHFHPRRADTTAGQPAARPCELPDNSVVEAGHSPVVEASESTKERVDTHELSQFRFPVELPTSRNITPMSDRQSSLYSQTEFVIDQYIRPTPVVSDQRSSRYDSDTESILDQHWQYR